MIILFGVVGSGKSEQASRLLAKLNCPYISTSHLLKENLTPGREARILAGKLVDDGEVLSLLEPAVDTAHAADQECILDGAPRSIGQAKWLIAKIKKGDLHLTAVIYLKVSKEVVLKRLMSRGRDDDKESIISQRFKEYDNITRPVIDYLKSERIEVSEVDASLSSEDVEAEIDAVLKVKEQ